jgi:IS30 family transposase
VSSPAPFGTSTDREGFSLRRFKTFSCDPHSPWQKGGIENAIGRLRRPLPRKSDRATIPREQLNAIADAYNNTPRTCLRFRTPIEVFRGFNRHVAPGT